MVFATEAARNPGQTSSSALRYPWKMLIKCHPGIRGARAPRGATLDALHLQWLMATETARRSLARKGNAMNQRFPNDRKWLHLDLNDHHLERVEGISHLSIVFTGVSVFA
jgi:hypothetical protein